MNDEGIIWTDREKALLEEMDRRVDAKLAPIREGLLNVSNGLQKIVALIEAAGGERQEKGEGDLLWDDKGWIDQEREKALERRKKEGRAPFGLT